MTPSHLACLQDGKTSQPTRWKDIPAEDITNQHIPAEDAQRQPAAALTDCRLKGGLGPYWGYDNTQPHLCLPHDGGSAGYVWSWFQLPFHP
jgi:hypothetical protein